MSLANNIVAIGCVVFSKNVLRIAYRVAIYFILKYGQIPILFSSSSWNWRNERELYKLTEVGQNTRQPQEIHLPRKS